MSTYTELGVSLAARALFYPSLLINIARERLQEDWHWCDLIAENLMLGAIPFPSMLETEFQQLGVKAVVTLNEEFEIFISPDQYAAAGIAHLHLPTIDFLFAPPLEDLHRGVDFISEHIERGELVYVHCKAGRGRSTSLVLCYLIKHRGMAPSAALEFVQARRPQVRLHPMQWRSIEKFWRACGSPGADTRCEAAISAIAAEMMQDSKQAAEDSASPAADSDDASGSDSQAAARRPAIEAVLLPTAATEADASEASTEGGIRNVEDGDAQQSSLPHGRLRRPLSKATHLTSSLCKSVVLAAAPPQLGAAAAAQLADSSRSADGVRSNHISQSVGSCQPGDATEQPQPQPDPDAAGMPDAVGENAAHTEDAQNNCAAAPMPHWAGDFSKEACTAMPPGTATSPPLSTVSADNSAALADSSTGHPTGGHSVNTSPAPGTAIAEAAAEAAALLRGGQGGAVMEPVLRGSLEQRPSARRRTAGGSLDLERSTSLVWVSAPSIDLGDSLRPQVSGGGGGGGNQCSMVADASSAARGSGASAASKCAGQHSGIEVAADHVGGDAAVMDVGGGGSSNGSGAGRDSVIGGIGKPTGPCWYYSMLPQKWVGR